MAKRAAPQSPTHKGFFYDEPNDRLEVYYNGALKGSFGPANGIQTEIVRLGSASAVASDGGAAILADMAFVAPADLKIVSAWRMNLTATDVSAGTGPTAVTTATYRRMQLITNTAGTGSGANIVASLNATASAASKVTRSFDIVASTVPANAIVLCSHLTVGDNTANGTDMAANIVEIAYELV
jgi:hypothetical protein